MERLGQSPFEVFVYLTPNIRINTSVILEYVSVFSSSHNQLQRSFFVLIKSLDEAEGINAKAF